MAKKLKQICGVGGGYKNKEIYVQGNQRDKVSKFLEKLGATVKRVVNLIFFFLNLFLTKRSVKKCVQRQLFKIK